jgi:hypothetical protein
VGRKASDKHPNVSESNTAFGFMFMHEDIQSTQKVPPEGHAQKR